MARITVRRVPKHERTGHKQWQVKKNGRRVSTHRLKSGAQRKADQLAETGDSKQASRLDGTFQNEATDGVFGPRGDQG